MFKGWFYTNKENAALKTTALQRNNEWHLNGELVREEKILALGRSNYYIAFIKTLSEKLKKKVFQSDFMTWDKNKSSWDNLKYYIDTADEIHFSLRGVDIDSLNDAFKKDEFIPYMTSREIRYIYYNLDALKKTVWYIENEETAQFLRKKGITRIGKYRSNSLGLQETYIMQEGYKLYNLE
jgi:hypothetical protein